MIFIFGGPELGFCRIPLVCFALVEQPIIDLQTNLGW